MKFALVGDALRSVWRRIKEPVLAGRGNVVQRLIYHALARFVADHKRLVAASDLETRALWLMYHPEVGILPCEGWRMNVDPIYVRPLCLGAGGCRGLGAGCRRPSRRS